MTCVWCSMPSTAAVNLPGQHPIEIPDKYNQRYPGQKSQMGNIGEKDQDYIAPEQKKGELIAAVPTVHHSSEPVHKRYVVSFAKS